MQAMKLPRQVRSQAPAEGSKLGNEENRKKRQIVGQDKSLPLQDELKSNILVATRQYAKRQLTWFAREHKLTPVMLIGHQPFSAVLRTAAPSVLV